MRRRAVLAAVLGASAIACVAGPFAVVGQRHAPKDPPPAPVTRTSAPALAAVAVAETRERHAAGARRANAAHLPRRGPRERLARLHRHGHRRKARLFGRRRRGGPLAEGGAPRPRGVRGRAKPRSRERGRRVHLRQGSRRSRRRVRARSRRARWTATASISSRSARRPKASASPRRACRSPSNESASRWESWSATRSEARSRAPRSTKRPRRLLDDALDGHAELSDLRAGTRLRIVATEERIEGAFVGYAPIDAVEYTPAGKPAIRVYWYAKGTEQNSSSNDPHHHARGGYYDAQGRQPYHGAWRSPVPMARISSRFNPNRMHPVLHVVMPHNGIDFAAPPGTPVYAAASGTIRSVGDSGPCGNMVQIEHAGGLISAYCHLSRFASISAGEHVETRQLIGYVGQTGRATGPHLHFAVKRQNGGYRAVHRSDGDEARWCKDYPTSPSRRLRRAPKGPRHRNRRHLPASSDRDAKPNANPNRLRAGRNRVIAVARRVRLVGSS